MEEDFVLFLVCVVVVVGVSDVGVDVGDDCCVVDGDCVVGVVGGGVGDCVEGDVEVLVVVIDGGFSEDCSFVVD